MRSIVQMASVKTQNDSRDNGFYLPLCFYKLTSKLLLAFFIHHGLFVISDPGRITVTDHSKRLLLQLPH